MFWAGVALTIVLVALGIWYYVRDDYPFQITASEITGLSYRSTASGAVVSGYIARPPVELAGWISSMEKDSSDQAVPVTTVVTIMRSSGPALRLSIGGARGVGRWLDADGVATAPVGVQLGQAFLWYVRGVGDALATGRHGVTPRSTPLAVGASPPSPPAASPAASPMASPATSPRPTPAASHTP